jgi:hypothetical protein
MKKIIIVLAGLILASSNLKADEGMWLPLFVKRLNYVDMQKQGLQLTPKEIYDVNNASLKDAIVRLGGGFCTGEIISGQGLMLTNHHCGYGVIQEKSTEENNYLDNGFWAMNKDEELPAGFSVSFLPSGFPCGIGALQRNSGMRPRAPIGAGAVAQPPLCNGDGLARPLTVRGIPQGGGRRSRH